MEKALYKIAFCFYLLGIGVIALVVAIFALTVRLILSAEDFYQSRNFYGWKLRELEGKLKKYIQIEYKEFEIWLICKFKDHDWGLDGSCRRGCGWHKCKKFDKEETEDGLCGKGGSVVSANMCER